jgi:signal transduction histidine kinase/CheY-like chemotaxis protein
MAPIPKAAVLEAISTAQAQFILSDDPCDIFRGLLDRALELTESKYGLIAEKVEDENGNIYLKTRALTNIAWNKDIAKLYEDNIQKGFIFKNLDNLFGKPVLTGDFVISNDPQHDPRSCGERLPQGHPKLNAFLGYPLRRGDTILGVVGLADREGGYTKEMLPALEPFFSTISILIEAFRNNEQRKMAEKKVQQMYHHLEQLVQDRTAELAHAKEEAEKALKGKTDFLAMISHELRTPLNGVIGLTGLLLSSSKLELEEKQYVENIRSSGEALLYLLNDILDYSKMESSMLELEEMNFDIRHCVEEVGDIMAFQAQDKGVELFTVVSRNIPTEVVGDNGRVRQVLLNLTSNAVKFTDQGHVCIRVDLKEQTDKDVVLRFSVEDTGVGIPESAQPKIFKPFSQASPSHQRTHGGTGLGLAISRQLARMMGGDLTFTSVESIGSTFIFEGRFTKVLQSLSPAYVDMEDLKGKKVLVVPQHPIFRESITEMLTTLKCSYELLHDSTIQQLSLVTAISGKIATSSIDLILLSYSDLKTVGSEQIREWTNARARIVCLCKMQELQGALANIPQDLADRVVFLQTPLKLQSLVKGYKQLLGRRSSGRFSTQFAGCDTAHVPILVVDDNATNQMVLQKTLNRLGFSQVDVVSNGREACQAVVSRLQHGKPYKLCFMDYYMPVCNGCEAIKCIRKYEQERNVETPLVMITMTAGTLRGDRIECMNAGSNEMLGKPLKIEELVLTLRKYLL